MSEISADCAAQLNSPHLAGPKAPTLLSSSTPRNWEALGKFLARARQIRRKFRTEMIDRNTRFMKLSFESQRLEWRNAGKHVCRHGVFFDTTSPFPCPCLGPPLSADWSRAILMPALHNDLKCIVTDSFDQASFVRLGQLHAEIRRRGW